MMLRLHFCFFFTKQHNSLIHMRYFLFHFLHCSQLFWHGFILYFFFLLLSFINFRLRPGLSFDRSSMFISFLKFFIFIAPGSSIAFVRNVLESSVHSFLQEIHAAQRLLCVMFYILPSLLSRALSTSTF